MSTKGLSSSNNNTIKLYGSIPDTDDVEEAQSLLNASDDQHDENEVEGRSGFSCYIFVTVLLIVCIVSMPVLKTSDGGASSSLFHIGSMKKSSFAINENIKIPFLHVDRSEFGKNPVPASSIVDPELFSPSLRGDVKNSSSLLKVPFPTGAFWTNLVVNPTADRLFSYPIMAYPYGFKWNPDLLQVSLPSLRRLMDSVSIRDIFNADLTLSSVEDVDKRYIQYFDPLSVTLRFQSNNDASFWETYIVQGSPYITTRYENMTPQLQALSVFQKISCLEKAGDRCTNLDHGDDKQNSAPSFKRLRGSQFAIQTMENLTWLLFTSDPVTLVFDEISKTSITFEEAFSGVVRVALIPPTLEDLTEFTSKFPQTYSSIFDEGEEWLSSPGVQMLVEHSNIYPVGADLSWDFPSKNVGNLQFKYKTKSMLSDSNKKGIKNKNVDLLMLALPHHTDALSLSAKIKSDQDFDLVYRTIKGHMTAVVGSVWSLKESLTSIGFDDDVARDQVSKLSKKAKTTILDQVTLDLKVVLPTMDENVYGFGKQVARLAQLIHIANVLLHADNGLRSHYESVVKAAQDSLSGFLTAFLSGETDDYLVYDTNFGGLVTQDGLNDFMNDFGNGWYNDHHFHYGYCLYACALLGRWNSTFVSQFGPSVDAISYDVTHSSYGSSDDAGSDLGAFFPLARHKSWFDGHSFASGLFPFASGKSMESSSESINCYYGSYLWSTVRDNSKKSSDQLDFARLLLAMEIRGVKTYWHMMPTENATAKSQSDTSQGLYNAVFTKNLMVGNLGMMDATVSTWFGNNPLYVHMINFLPVTAITRELFDKSYLKKEYNDVIKPMYDSVEMAWKGYVICDRAMLEPNKAWEDALELRSYELDQAVSQSQVLYFISTSDGFEGSGNEDGDEGDNFVGNDDLRTSSKPEGSDGSAFCIDHEVCDNMKLTGMCCPPAPGAKDLNCCNSVMVGNSPSKQDNLPIEDGKENTAGNSDKSLCTENERCATLSLTGLCCPAPGGQNLSCCD